MIFFVFVLVFFINAVFQLANLTVIVDYAEVRFLFRSFSHTTEKKLKKKQVFFKTMVVTFCAICKVSGYPCFQFMYLLF